MPNKQMTHRVLLLGTLIGVSAVALAAAESNPRQDPLMLAQAGTPPTSVPSTDDAKKKAEEERAKRMKEGAPPDGSRPPPPNGTGSRQAPPSSSGTGGQTTGQQPPSGTGGRQPPSSSGSSGQTTGQQPPSGDGSRQAPPSSSGSSSQTTGQQPSSGTGGRQPPSSSGSSGQTTGQQPPSGTGGRQPPSSSGASGQTAGQQPPNRPNDASGQPPSSGPSNNEPKRDAPGQAPTQRPPGGSDDSWRGSPGSSGDTGEPRKDSRDRPPRRPGEEGRRGPPGSEERSGDAGREGSRPPPPPPGHAGDGVRRGPPGAGDMPGEPGPDGTRPPPPGRPGDGPRQGPPGAEGFPPPLPADELEKRRKARQEFSRDDLPQVSHQRKERRDDSGRVFIEEPGQRLIYKEDGRAFIRHDETDRLRHGARDFREETGPGGERRQIYSRPNGVTIITVVDREGRMVKRVRRAPDGSETLLIDNRPDRWSQHKGRAIGGFGYAVELPPPAVSLAVDKHTLNADGASEDQIYAALAAEPLDRIAADYTLDEIRYSPALRERMRRVNLSTVNFDSGSWAVPVNQIDRLAKVAHGIRKLLRANPDEVFLISGHTDAVGGAEDNLSLSDRRAESVARVLTDEFGIPAENLVTQGYGEQFLAVSTQGSERRNRRVEFQRITPLLARK